MPESIAIASFVLGAVLFLVAFLGGQFKIFGAEISGKTGGIMRFFAFVFGSFFILIGFVFGILPYLMPAQSVQSTQPPENTEIPNVIPTANIEVFNTPSETTILEPAALPANTSCPGFNGASWLSTPGYWYGPYESNGVTYTISFDQFYIYVWNSYSNTVIPYSDPAVYGGRNQWLSLSGSPFTTCVDSLGNVYSSFTP